MKKILFYIYSLNKGGAERVLVTLCKQLKEQYEVVILTDCQEKKEYDLPKGIRRIDIQKECGRGNALFRLQKIRHFIKMEKPDIVIAFMVSSAIRAILATRFLNQKIVGAVRSNPYDEYASTKKRLFLNLIFAMSDGVICQTQYQKEYFTKALQKKCVVILNPITDEFTKIAIDRKPDNRIVTVGRLYDYKNHAMLIRSFKKVAERYQDKTLVIYGDGPYKEETETLIEKLGLKGKVILAGDVLDVALKIKDAAIFALPSDTEGMPNALMEAMALELPCIATDCPCGGPKTLIEDGVNGFLCAVNDDNAMAEKMFTLIENPKLAKQIGKKAGEIKKTCCIEEISAKWREYIERTCK